LEISASQTCFSNPGQVIAHEKIELQVICNVFDESKKYFESNPLFYKCLDGEYDTVGEAPSCAVPATFLYNETSTVDSEVFPLLGIATSDSWLANVTEGCYNQIMETKSPTFPPLGGQRPSASPLSIGTSGVGGPNGSSVSKIGATTAIIIAIVLSII
jgi:hypothetical protein